MGNKKGLLIRGQKSCRVVWYICTFIDIYKDGTLSIYIYECSTYWYVKLNALNILNVHGPCINAPTKTYNKAHTAAIAIKR